MTRTEEKNQKLAVNTQGEVEKLLAKILKTNAVLSNFGKQKESSIDGGLLKGSIRTSTEIDLNLASIMENMIRFQIRKTIRFRDEKLSVNREYGGAPSREEVEHLYDELDSQKKVIKGRVNNKIDLAFSEEKKRVRAFGNKVEEIRRGIAEKDEEKIKRAVENLSENELKSEIDMPVIYKTAEAFLEPCRKVQEGEFSDDEKEIAARLEEEILEAMEEAKVANVVFFNPLNGKGIYGSKKYEPVHSYRGQVDATIIAHELCRNAA